jgi:Fibronectin type III domain
MDGGKKAIAARNHQATIVIKMLRTLGHWVEANCNEDIKTFLGSGFQAASTNSTKAQPVSEKIRKIEPGKKSGEESITLVDDPEALSYEVRYTQLVAGATPTTWTTQAVGLTKPPALVVGLTPGANYAFQVRALTRSGYTDWSDSVTRICI